MPILDPPLHNVALGLAKHVIRRTDQTVTPENRLLVIQAVASHLEEYIRDRSPQGD